MLHSNIVTVLQLSVPLTACGLMARLPGLASHGSSLYLGATTPDKTVETFQYNFQFRTMVPLCPKETNLPPSPPLVQCCFGLAAQACISCVTTNNIAIGEGETVF